MSDEEYKALARAIGANPEPLKSIIGNVPTLARGLNISGQAGLQLGYAMDDLRYGFGWIEKDKPATDQPPGDQR